MTIPQTPRIKVAYLIAQAELLPSVLFGEREGRFWPYRRRTMALLRRFARCSVEVGRVPSLLGREFFRSHVTSYTMRNFEDVAIFVTDMEQAIDKLSPIAKKLLAMNVLEEYTQDEVARLLGYNLRTVRRLLQGAVDQLSEILLTAGLMEEIAEVKSCQEGRNYKFSVSRSKEGKNKYTKNVRIPPSNLVS